MKKHENAIKALMKNVKGNEKWYGYFEDENGARYLMNMHIVIKLTGSTLDYVGDLPRLDNIKLVKQFIDIIETFKKGEYKTTVKIQDIKVFDRYNTDKKPFCAKYSDNGYIGFNPYYFNKLNILTGSDLLTITDSISPIYIAGNDIECVLLPVALDKNYNSDNYAVFLEELKACYIQDEETKKEKAAKKANKDAGIIPTLQPNKNYNGFTMSFYGVDYFILSDAKRITKSIITEFIKAYCKRNNFSDTVLNDMLSSKIQLDNIKARIEKATFILNTNADNSAFTYIDIKTKYAFNGCMYFECDNKLVLIGCVLPTSTETKEETPKTATIQDNNADIVADPETTNETTAADVMSANNTDKAATKDMNTDLKTIETPVILRYSDYEHIRIKKGYYINISNYDYIIYQKQATNEYTIYNLNYMTPYGYDDFKTVSDAVNHLNDTADKQNEYYNIHNHYTKQEIYNIYASYNFYNKYELVKQYVEKDIQPDHETPKQTDKPHKANKKAMCLFIVTDKPAPVKLSAVNIPTLERIPTYTQRIISRLQPLKSHRVYNTRVSNKKPLKKAYNDFVGTASMSCDKCAMGGGSVAVNSS